jgi:hypothetical protein
MIPEEVILGGSPTVRNIDGLDPYSHYGSRPSSQLSSQIASTLTPRSTRSQAKSRIDYFRSK